MGSPSEAVSAASGLDANEAAQLSAFSATLDAERSSLIIMPGESLGPTPDTPLLGNYQVTGPLGQELDAELIRAVQLRVGGESQDCVLKRLHRADAIADEYRQSRLLTEGQASMGLAHPNVVQVMDYGSLDGWVCLAREYVQGASLRAIRGLAAGQQMPVSVVVFLGYQSADALACAHEHAEKTGHNYPLVHGRLCPSDILVTPRGEIKITEMGVAAFGADQVPYPEGSSRWRLRYMAPEQVRREFLDRRSDIFSLGLLMSELLGPRALAPDSGVDYKALPKVVRLRAGQRNDVPDALTCMLLNMTAVNPDERPASARQIANALAVIAAEFGDREALEKQLRTVLAGAVDLIQRRQVRQDNRANQHEHTIPPRHSQAALLSALGSVDRGTVPAPVLSAIPLPGSVYGASVPAPVLSAIPLPGSVAGASPRTSTSAAGYMPSTLPEWAHPQGTAPTMVSAAPAPFGSSTAPWAAPSAIGGDAFGALDSVLAEGSQGYIPPPDVSTQPQTSVSGELALTSLTVAEDTITKVASITERDRARKRKHRLKIGLMCMTLSGVLAFAAAYFQQTGTL